MKIAGILLLALLLWTNSYGQRIDSLKHALDVFGETNGLSNRSNSSMATAGIQYNKQVNKYFGYKLMLGYTGYCESPNLGVTYVTGDTAPATLQRLFVQYRF